MVRLILCFVKSKSLAQSHKAFEMKLLYKHHFSHRAETGRSFETGKVDSRCQIRGVPGDSMNACLPLLFHKRGDLLSDHVVHREAHERSFGKRELNRGRGIEGIRIVLEEVETSRSGSRIFMKSFS